MECARQTGCSGELILAQAALETGWGQKVFPETNNIFNIKADKSWRGERATFNVHEYHRGKKIFVDADFRVYPDLTAALLDRTEFLRKNPRYRGLGLFDVSAKNDFELDAAAIQKAGYATDPNYAATMIKIFNGPTMRKAIAEAKAQAQTTGEKK
jgi:flagellar protein FlgJ